MKYCSHCGNELCDEAVICPSCGCSVAGGKIAAAKQALTGGISTFALVGFILSFFAPLIGLILSILGYNNAKAEGDDRSKTYAKAGIIISSVWIGIVIIICIGVGTCAAVAAATYPY